MFNNNSDDQKTNTDIDEVAKDINENAPHIGIGSNPSTFTPVMPPQAQTTPPPADDSAPADSSVVTTPEVITSPSVSAPSAVPADLNNIREDALKQLSPLVGKLDQEPEERFKTLMMMIQASDNHDLIKEAYEAANKIADETVKAQALLSIVNEINYFTQKHSS